jgi:hypothetical protein
MSALGCGLLPEDQSNQLVWTSPFSSTELPLHLDAVALENRPEDPGDLSGAS